MLRPGNFFACFALLFGTKAAPLLCLPAAHFSISFWLLRKRIEIDSDKVKVLL